MGSRSADGAQRQHVLRRLIEYVLEAPVETVAALTLQDLALCAQWAAVHGSDATHLQETATLRERIASWLEVETVPQPGTCGRRRQPLLRQKLGLLAAEGAHLRREEIDFLLEVNGLIAHHVAPQRFERVAEVVSPHVERLRALQGSTAPDVLETAFHGSMLYLREQDLTQARPREVRLLGGIELPHRGPVYTAPCTVRVLGDVPDDCTLVVEKGACSVDGYLLGRVLAHDHCDVIANIAGVCVAQRGDIRARNIINNAFVVAKLGDVHGVHAENAKLVFAGNELVLYEDSFLGNMKARAARVGGTVHGGAWHVAGPLSAYRFDHHRQQHLSIVLRRELTCEDYGEVTGPDLNRLLSAAYRLRTRAHHFDSLATLATDEAEQLAQSALMFLFGGGAAQKLLEELSAEQQRARVLRRVIKSIHEVRVAAEERLVRPGAITSWFIGPESSWMHMEDLTRLDTDEPVDGDLAEANAHAQALHKEILSKQLSRSRAARILEEAGEKVRALNEELEELTQSAQEKAEALQAMPALEALMGSTQDGNSRLQVLQKVLLKLRASKTKNTVTERLQTPFVTLSMRNIERRLSRARHYREQARGCLDNFSGVSERLGAEYQVRIGDTNTPQAVASATGRFAADVWIYLDMEGEGGAAQDVKRLEVTAETGDETATYRRRTREDQYV